VGDPVLVLAEQAENTLLGKQGTFLDRQRILSSKRYKMSQARMQSRREARGKAHK